MKDKDIMFKPATREESFVANQNGKIVKVEAVGLSGISAKLKYPYSREEFDSKLNLFVAMYTKDRELIFSVEYKPNEKVVKSLI